MKTWVHKQQHQSAIKMAVPPTSGDLQQYGAKIEVTPYAWECSRSGLMSWRTSWKTELRTPR